MLARLIILNWNGRRWLEPCLSAVLAQDLDDCEVVLVDNGSTDGSSGLVRERFPSVHVKQLPDNIGFARGNNAGAVGATSRYLVFLNNDTRVRSGWLRTLVDAMEADPTIGLATSQLVYSERPDLIDSAGDGYLRCGGAFKHWHGRPAATAPGTRDVFSACGAAFIIRTTLFEAMGGFDEDFGMVYEDVDLSFRAHLRGARCRYVAEAVVEHAGSGTMGRVSSTAVFYGQRNLEWTWLKNTPSAILWRSAPSHVAYGMASAVGYAFRGQLGVWCRAKLAALAGWPDVRRKRRQVQQTVVGDGRALWQAMDTGWIRRKYREKGFDFQP